MTVLWSKFPDEVLSGVAFSDADKKRLEDIFSNAPGSAWRQALKAIGAKGADGASLIHWRGDVPYFNWSQMIEAVGGGVFQPVKDADNLYKIIVSYKLRALIDLAKTQWGMTRFLQKVQPRAEPLIESIALGLILQSLMMRLGAQAALLPQWLADPAAVPTQYKKTAVQIQEIQMARTSLSYAWHDLFPEKHKREEADLLPDMFWDNEFYMPSLLQRTPDLSSEWKGQPVCAGTVTGLVVLVNLASAAPDIQALKEQYKTPVILLFRQARPDSVTFFEKADGLLFAQGGVLSHACTVAREMRIPSVTGLGDPFLKFVESKERFWITMHGDTGKLNIVE